MQPQVSIWSDLIGIDVQQQMIDAGGVRTRVLHAGEGPPLILIHGTGGHLEAYARNIAELSSHFRVVVYDMVGHGYSAKPDRPYTIDVLSGHLIDVMDALDIQRAHLSGESIGGWVAAWTAAHNPARVDRLVLNTPGNITNKPEVMARVKNSSLKAVREATMQSVRERVEWLFHDKSLVTDELVALRYAIYTQPGFERAMENILAMQEPETRAPFVWRPEWCQEISAVTLLLWTDHDPTGGMDEAALLEKWIPDTRLEIIEGAGHWPQWEKPDEFHEVHERFLLARGTDDAARLSAGSNAG
jgi:2-hydroxy-6-oxonona-2,4-dienedioate hydrolase